MRETDELDDYLAQERAQAFEWTGQRNGDCQLFPIGWAERIGWPLAGASWRGRYSSEEEARALVDRRGGLVSAGCELFGPPRIGSAAQRGDVGLLAAEGWHLGMICTGSMWVIRAGDRGIRFCRREPDIIWDLRFRA
ncbi:DUF6950 family protein [Rhizobium halophytocola]|uniref:DUF6950 domain-containing protein n=1 Tax=Rhizobium halophytocola TaxID=735519 RepID=A0ABS4DVJ3_9HYPH|nr:hypothetical protein [Rhizobium halophytocola]MBP1849700.1 hypothetical protein [Rhizobium halophytocola]